MEKEVSIMEFILDVVIFCLSVRLTIYACDYVSRQFRCDHHSWFYRLSLFIWYNFICGGMLWRCWYANIV